MARRKRESREERQNRGYDEAVRGRPGVANERPDRMIPVSGEESQLQNTTEDVDEREARRAREQVREHDRSASRPGSREP